MTGTNDGTDVTHASYKATSVHVDSWLNTRMNEAGHITLGLVGQPQVGKIRKVTRISYPTFCSTGSNLMSYLEQSSLKRPVS